MLTHTHTRTNIHTFTDELKHKRICINYISAYFHILFTLSILTSTLSLDVPGH